tara:strand:- start:943 stop:1395 length:453 start_codon:yes stop_codon:yes gene_type:complete
MAVTNIDEALLSAAQQDALNMPSLQNAVLLGSTLGAGIGIAGGQLPHQIGLNINKVKDQLAARQGLTRKGIPLQKKIGSRMRPGARVAGGLAGLILGGGLGAAVRNASMQDSVPAQLLAKLQVQGSLSPDELYVLERELGQIYSQSGGVA